MWDYVHTLRTGPVQDKVAPLWKVFPVPMGVGQNTDMFVRNNASVGVHVYVMYLYVCLSEIGRA